ASSRFHNARACPAMGRIARIRTARVFPADYGPGNRAEIPPADRAGAADVDRAAARAFGRTPLFDAFEDAYVIRNRGAAHVENSAELRVGDLHVAGGLGELHGGERMHGDPRRPDG